MSADLHERTAEAAWRWVLDQVRHDEHGPWMPTAVTDPPVDEPPSDRDGMHSGVAGLAHVLAEIRLARAWTAEESALADAIATRLRATVAETTDTTYFDGLVSTIGALIALEADGAEEAVARLAALAGADGWPQTIVGPPRALPDARINDVTLGTGAVLLGALWAHRYAVPGARDLAEQAADILLAEAEEHSTGLNWPFVPHRFRSWRPATCRTSRTASPGSRPRWPPPGSRSTGPTSSTPHDAAASTWSRSRTPRTTGSSVPRTGAVPGGPATSTR